MQQCTTLHEAVKHLDSYVTHVFFFSSRRRHTRYWRDWSSDVCSSDLCARPAPGGRGGFLAVHKSIEGDEEVSSRGDSFRSEERRVGKECRSRWSPYH